MKEKVKGQYCNTIVLHTNSGLNSVLTSMKPLKAWKLMREISKSIQTLTGSQCKFARIGLMCSYHLEPLCFHSAAFCSRALTDAGIKCTAILLISFFSLHLFVWEVNTFCRLLVYRFILFLVWRWIICSCCPYKYESARCHLYSIRLWQWFRMSGSPFESLKKDPLMVSHIISTGMCLGFETCVQQSDCIFRVRAQVFYSLTYTWDLFL